MPLLGRAAVAMWWDMAPAQRAEFEDWHSHEHFPERMGIPGFLRGSRWASATGGEGFFVIYELDAYETLTSPHYLARLNNPTPWSAKMMPHHRNMVRSQCRVLESFGGGVAGAMMTVRLSPADGRSEALRMHLAATLSALPLQPGLTGGHLLQTQTPDAAMTKEQQIRGGDAEADWIVLVTGYDATVTGEAVAKLLTAPALGGAMRSPPIVAPYRLSYTFAKSDLRDG
jgi:hypothetical protein